MLLLWNHDIFVKLISNESFTEYRNEMVLQVQREQCVILHLNVVGVTLKVWHNEEKFSDIVSSGFHDLDLFFEFNCECLECLDLD